MRIVISIILWMVGAVLATLALLASLFFAIVLFPFDKQRKVVHAQWFWLAEAITRVSPYWNVRIGGLENIDKNKAYVIVANHQSLADIVVMYKTHMQFKWVAKASLYKTPPVSAFLLLGKHIMLSTCKLQYIKKFYKEAAHCLKNGMSLVFFPEGTRSETGNLGEFHNGAFKLAIKENKPILPIIITGTKKILPKWSWIFNAKAAYSLTVLPPIDTTDFRYRDFRYLKDVVYSKFKNMKYMKEVS